MDEATVRYIGELKAEALALRMVLSHLIKRLSREYEDPDHFVMTLTAALREGAEAVEDGEEGRILADTFCGVADGIEEAALD